MKISDILAKAADLIEPEGAWGQHGYEPRQGCYCALGAIAKAANANPEWSWGDTAMLDARAAVELAFGPRLYKAVDWNDTPGRTQPEVVAKLREAAAVARERGL